MKINADYRLDYDMDDIRIQKRGADGWCDLAPISETAAMVSLETHHWPGNVRELRNVVERAVYRHEDPERAISEITFDPFHSPWAPSGTAPQPVAPAESDGSASLGSRTR